MMKRLVFLFILSLFASPAWAVTITACTNLSWNANTEPDLAGYNVSINKDGVDLPLVPVAAPATTLDCSTAGIVEGSSYIWTLTAFDTSGNESAPTAPFLIDWPDGTPPATPTGSCVQFTDAAGVLQCVVMP